MDVWRLTRPEFAPGLDGIGARREGGRWNSPGIAAVYCASSLSLATLEIFVHLPPAMRTPEKMPDFVAVKLRVPDEMIAPKPDMAAMSAMRNVGEFRTIGDTWLTACETLALRVPSLVVSQEENLVLNPNHTDIAKVDVLSTEPFRLDARFFEV